MIRKRGKPLGIAPPNPNPMGLCDDRAVHFGKDTKVVGSWVIRTACGTGAYHIFHSDDWNEVDCEHCLKKKGK